MSLVFYYAPFSSASTSHWALEELGVPYEKVKLNLADKDAQKPAFLALNPNGKVPLLVHDGVPIFESIAIIAYLGETFGVEKKLFPAPGLVRSQALQWLAWTNVSLGGAAGRYLANTNEKIPAELRNAKAAAMHEKEVYGLFGILDRHLAGRKWAVGDEFSLVDLHLAGAVGWIRQLGFETERFANIGPWFAKCCARPAFATVMAP